MEMALLGKRVLHSICHWNEHYLGRGSLFFFNFIFMQNLFDSIKDYNRLCDLNSFWVVRCYARRMNMSVLCSCNPTATAWREKYKESTNVKYIEKSRSFGPLHCSFVLCLWKCENSMRIKWHAKSGDWLRYFLTRKCNSINEWIPFFNQTETGKREISIHTGHIENL